VSARPLKIGVFKFDPAASIPYKAHPGDVALDVCSLEAFSIRPGERHVAKTGLGFELPAGHELQVRPRSGLAANHGITIINSPATFEPTYRGELKIILLNTDLKQTFEVQAGDRIAQLVVKPFIETVETFELSEIDQNTERGDRGLGSSGK